MPINILVIGVGGFGRGVCNQLLVAPEANYAKDRGDLGISLLVIDGPKADASYAVPLGVEIETDATSRDFLGLDDNLAPKPILEAIAKNDTSSALGGVVAMARKFLDADSAGRCPVLPPSDGFGGCRPPGHLYVQLDGARIRAQIRERAESARQPFPDDGLIVFVVGSVAGGTGAGMLADVIALTRDALRGVDDAFVVGIVPTPVDYPTRQGLAKATPEVRTQHFAKGYAAFRDVNRLQQCHDASPATIPLGLERPVVLTKYLDVLIAVEESQPIATETVQRSIVPAVADFIFGIAEADNRGQPSVFGSQRINWQTYAATAQQRSASFAALSVASVRFTAGECTDLLTALAVRQVVDEVLAPGSGGTEAADAAIVGTWPAPESVRRFPTGTCSYSVFASTIAGLEWLSEVPAELVQPARCLVPKRLFLFFFEREWPVELASPILENDFSQQNRWITAVLAAHARRLRENLDAGFAELRRSRRLMPLEAFTARAKACLAGAVAGVDAAIGSNQPPPAFPARASADVYNELQEQRLSHQLLVSLRNMLVRELNKWEMLHKDITDDTAGWKRALADVAASASDAAEPLRELRKARAAWAHQVRLPLPGKEEQLLKADGVKKAIGDYLGALSWALLADGPSVRLALSTPRTGTASGLSRVYSRRVSETFAGGFEADQEASYLRDRLRAAVLAVPFSEVAALQWGSAWPTAVAGELAEKGAALLATPGTTPVGQVSEFLVGAVPADVSPFLAAKLPQASGDLSATSVRFARLQFGFPMESMRWVADGRSAYRRHQQNVRGQPVDIYRPDVNAARLLRRFNELALFSASDWAPEVVGLLEYMEPFGLFSLAYALGAIPTVQCQVGGARMEFAGYKGRPPWKSNAVQLDAQAVPDAAANLLIGPKDDPFWLLQGIQRHYTHDVTPEKDPHSEFVLRDLQVRILGRPWLQLVKSVPGELDHWYRQVGGDMNGVCSLFDPSDLVAAWALALAIDGTRLSRLDHARRAQGLDARCKRSLLHELPVGVPQPRLHQEILNRKAPGVEVYQDLQHAMQAAISSTIDLFVPTSQPLEAIEVADVDAALAKLKVAVGKLPH